MKPNRISHNTRHHSFPQNQDDAAANKTHGEKPANAAGQDLNQSATPATGEQLVEPPDTEEKNKPRPKKMPPLGQSPRTQQSDSA